MKKKTDKNIHSRISSASNLVLKGLSSNRFFWITLTCFVLLSGWIAISMSYDMVYDERHHFRAIEVYSRQFSPFIETQPSDTHDLGDLTRNGSYLYHYLMSFPYRFIELFTESIFVKVVFLRFINIAIFATVLIFLRKLIRELRFSNLIANISVFTFASFPVTSFLAATINYDSLFMLLVTIHLLVFAKLCEKRFADLRLILLLISTGALGGITKFPFLPIFLFTTFCSVFGVLYIHRKKAFRAIFSEKSQYKKRALKVFAILAVVSTVLFLERYAYNTVVHKSPTPSCTAIHSIESCKRSGIWDRDTRLDEAHPDDPKNIQGMISFAIKHWYGSMTNSTTFIGGRSSSGVMELKASSHVARTALAWLGVIMIALCALVLPSLRKNTKLMLVLGASLVYATTLFLLNYDVFIRMGVPLAIQARYILWIIPLLLAVALYGVGIFVGALYKNTVSAKITLLVLSAIVFSQYGGPITFFYRYQPSWSWPDQDLVVKVNSLTGRVASRLVIGE